MKGIIVVNPERCVSCRTCEIQCAVAHSKSKVLRDAISEKHVSKPRLKIEGTAELAIPLQCRHCKDAPCVKICPTKAIERADIESPVLIEKERCVGCEMCILVCPFGVIRMDDKGKALINCDLCFERLKKGEKPACVEGCPTHALEFKTIAEAAGKGKKMYLVNFRERDKL